MNEWKFVRVDRIADDWDNINVRVGPGLSAFPVGRIVPGESVYLEETTTTFTINGYGWRRVKMDSEGDVYWVADELQYTTLSKADAETIPAQDNLAAQVQALSDGLDDLGKRYESLGVAYSVDVETLTAIANGIEQYINLELQILKVVSGFQAILEGATDTITES